MRNTHTVVSAGPLTRIFSLEPRFAAAYQKVPVKKTQIRMCWCSGWKWLRCPSVDVKPTGARHKQTRVVTLTPQHGREGWAAGLDAQHEGPRWTTKPALLFFLSFSMHLHVCVRVCVRTSACALRGAEADSASRAAEGSVIARFRGPF